MIEISVISVGDSVTSVVFYFYKHLRESVISTSLEIKISMVNKTSTLSLHHLWLIFTKMK